ncbi:unnamed protein product [Brassica oleracea]
MLQLDYLHLFFRTSDQRGFPFLCEVTTDAHLYVPHVSA